MAVHSTQGQNRAVRNRAVSIYIDKPICTFFCSTIRFGYRSRSVLIQSEATQTKNMGIVLLFLQF